jgi:hypothetical protein
MYDDKIKCMTFPIREWLALVFDPGAVNVAAIRSGLY